MKYIDAFTLIETRQCGVECRYQRKDGECQKCREAYKKLEELCNRADKEDK